MRRLTSCGSRGAETKSACPQKIGAILDSVRISLSFPSVASERASRLPRALMRPDLLVRSGAGWCACASQSGLVQGHHCRRCGI